MSPYPAVDVVLCFLLVFFSPDIFFLFSFFLGGGGVYSIFMHGRSRMTIDPHILQCRDGACRVFTDQADIASTKREAP